MLYFSTFTVCSLLSLTTICCAVSRDCVILHCVLSFSCVFVLFVSLTSTILLSQVVRQSGYGKQADIWSLGCTVVEMLTGSPPWAAEFSNHFTLMYHVASNSAPPPLPDNVPCSLELRDFLDKCFTADAHKRPSAQELLDHPFVKGIKDLRVKSPPSGQWNSRGVQNLVHERTASELSVDSAGSHNSDGRPKSWSSGRGNDF